MLTPRSFILSPNMGIRVRKITLKGLIILTTLRITLLPLVRVGILISKVLLNIMFLILAKVPGSVLCLQN